MTSLATRYVSRVGPQYGPMPVDFAWPAVDVYAETGSAPIGCARPRGCVSYDGAMAMVFRLTVSGADLPGLWVCDGRRFVPLAEEPV